MADNGQARILTFHEPDSHTAQYLVIDDSSKKAAVVDSVLQYNVVTGATSTAAIDELLAVVENEGLDVEWVLSTHAHDLLDAADHIDAACYVQKKVGGKTGIGAYITAVQSIFKGVFNMTDLVPDGRDFDVLFKDGDSFQIGNIEVQVMHTPGHTPACVSYYLVGDAVLVGDTIFQPDQGTARCDFPGGSSQTLWNSLQKLFTLPDETRVFTCHDYAPGDREEYLFESTIGEQKASNKHVATGTSEDQFVAWRAERDATLGLPRLFIPSLQLNVRAGKLPTEEVNGVAYLKIPLNLFTNMEDYLSKQGKFRVLDDEMIVGPYLQQEDIEYLASQGIVKSIMDVSSPTEDGHMDDEQAAVEAAGFAFASRPIDGPNATAADLEQAAAILADLPKPTLIHCRSGARGVIVVAALRLQQNPSLDSAALIDQLNIVKPPLKAAVESFAQNLS